MQEIQQWSDAFGTQIADSTTNEADIAGHYEFTPERWRFYVNGNREFLQYTSSPKYTETADGHRLTPAAGDTLEFLTAERYRYIVGYTIEPSWALEINQSLQSGDAVVLGYGDADLINGTESAGVRSLGPSADGWFWKWDAETGDSEVKLMEVRAGDVRDSTTVALEKPLTIWKRLATNLNWYNVGHAEYVETFTQSNSPTDPQQENRVRGYTAVDDGKGPESGNKHLRLQVHAGSGTSGFEVELGSVGLKTLGDVDGLVRPKDFAFTTASHSGGGTFEPLAAFRVAPSRELVNVQFTTIDPVSGPTGKISVHAVSPEKTDAGETSGWTTPPENSEANSALQYTTDVSTFPDSTGSVVSSAANPGGYQIGFGDTRSGGGNRPNESADRTQKRGLPDADIGVLLAETSTSGAYDVVIANEQDW